MRAPTVLIGLAFVIGVLAPRVLLRVPGLAGSPRLAIALWQTATAATLLSFLGGAVTWCLALWREAAALPMLDAGVALLRQRRIESPMLVIDSLGLLLASLVVARLCVHATRVGLGIRRARRAQRRRLDVLTRPSERWPHVRVLDRPEPTAFCVPGRGGDVVVSSGALRLLSAGEMRAVLAHERAHLRGHHDVIVTAAQVLRDAFAFVPLFAASAEELPGLVEMAADDAALRSTDLRPLTSALLSMAGASAPFAALGAGGATVASRVRRLLHPHRPGALLATAALTVGVAVLAAPLTIFGIALLTGCQQTLGA